MPISRHLVSLAEKYRPWPKSEVAVDIFREREVYLNEPAVHPLKAWRNSHVPDGGWNRWTRRRPRVHWLEEGSHESILNPPIVSSLAHAIRSAMDQHLKTQSPTQLKVAK
jgi:thioesterase domain-containing protein